MDKQQLEAKALERLDSYVNSLADSTERQLRRTPDGLAGTRNFSPVGWHMFLAEMNMLLMAHFRREIADEESAKEPARGKK